MNKYKNPNSSTVGATGQMFNEATKTEQNINYNHFGIFANDNTYAITFNPYINRPPTKYIQHIPVKPPPTDEHITKTYNEPPTSLTDGRQYLNNSKSKPPPLLPPYLNKPEDLGVIQGNTDERNKSNIIYNKPININKRNIHY